MYKKTILLFLVMLLLITACSSAKSSAPVNTPPPAVTKSEVPEAKEPTLPKPQKYVPPAGENEFPAGGVPILYYHTIDNLPGNDIGVPPEKFAAQMKYLHDTGYNVISLDRLYDAYQGTAKLPNKPVVITFDDGYPDNYSVAFPVLKQYNFTATFFVVSSFMEPGQGMLTWEQLREMYTYGMTIAGHTVTHADLSKLTLEQQRKELLESKQAIENKLGIKVNFFAYPFGNYNADSLKLLKQLDYKAAVITQSGFFKPKENLFLIKRVYVNGLKDLEDFKSRLGEKSGG